METDENIIFESTPEQIAAAKLSQELTELRIKFNAQTEEINYLKKNVEAANSTIRNLTERVNSSRIENSVLDEMIDKLVEKIAKS